MNYILSEENIQVDEATTNQASDYINNKVIQKIQDEGIIKLENLKAIAGKFRTVWDENSADIEAFEKAEKTNKGFRKLAKTQKVSIDEATDENGKISKRYADNKEKYTEFLHGTIPPQIYAAAYDFQIALNDFLGQSVQTIYVYEDENGNPILYTIQDLTSFLKYDVSSSGALSARINVTKTAINNTDGLQKYTQTEADPKLQNTYKEVLVRYRTSKRSKGVPWLNQEAKKPKWRWMSVSSEGDIQEAYATAVLSRQEENTNEFNNSLEKNIDTFMRNYVANVDRVSGLLQGDYSKILANNQGSIEYAIKSNRSSFLGLQQMRDVAQQVLMDDFDQKKLQDIKENFAKAAEDETRNVVTSFKKRVNKQLREMMKEISKSNGVT